MVESIVRYRASNGHEFETEDEAFREEAIDKLGDLIYEEINKRGNTADIIATFIIERHCEISELVDDFHNANSAIMRSINERHNKND